MRSRTIRRDEKDWDISQRQWRRQIRNPRTSIHTRAINTKGGIGVLKDGDHAGLIFRQALDGGLKDGCRPVRVAYDGALNGGNAYVEEAMAVAVNGQVLRSTLAWNLAGREKDLKDGLQKVGVEAQGNMDQAEGAVLEEY